MNDKVRFCYVLTHGLQDERFFETGFAEPTFPGHHNLLGSTPIGQIANRHFRASNASAPVHVPRRKEVSTGFSTVLKFQVFDLDSAIDGAPDRVLIATLERVFIRPFGRRSL
jgi:hypothetical protein